MRTRSISGLIIHASRVTHHGVRHSTSVQHKNGQPATEFRMKIPARWRRRLQVDYQVPKDLIDRIDHRSLPIGPVEERLRDLSEILPTLGTSSLRGTTATIARLVVDGISPESFEWTFRKRRGGFIQIMTHHLTPDKDRADPKWQWVATGVRPPRDPNGVKKAYEVCIERPIEFCRDQAIPINSQRRGGGEMQYGANNFGVYLGYLEGEEVTGDPVVVKYAKQRCSDPFQEARSMWTAFWAGVGVELKGVFPDTREPAYIDRRHAYLRRCPLGFAMEPAAGYFGKVTDMEGPIGEQLTRLGFGFHPRLQVLESDHGAVVIDAVDKDIFRADKRFKLFEKGG